MKKQNRQTKKTLKLVYELIEMHKQSADKEFQSAVDNQHWSQVSGWHGIGTGLLMAQKVIQEEMDAL